jgi:predicted nuclease with TOPRIM domain
MKNSKNGSMEDGKKGDKDTTVSRFVLFLKEKGISRNQFYVKHDVSVGTLGPDKNDISAKTIKKALDAFDDLNVHWLITGKGEMTVQKEEEVNVKQESVKLFKALEKIDKLRDELDSAQKEIKDYEIQLRSKSAENYDLKMKIKELEQALKSQKDTA